HQAHRIGLKVIGKPTSSLLGHEHLHGLHYEAYRGVRSNWTTSWCEENQESPSGANLAGILLDTALGA
ncbi:hypothetical protein, partial [Halomonas salifodinae]|uniref:hypothetical protein n=1 Tax=Halomonas salifodinae TaxID=438745 RepID=UPI0031F7E56F